MLPEDRKKYRNRASRARRALLREKERFQEISDGSGKRYRVCVFFVLSGAPEKAVEFLDWFEQEFPEDCGEPVFLLFASLAHYRTGSLEKARKYLLDTMVRNIYLLPYVCSQPLTKVDLWHPSNWSEPAYIEDVAEFPEEPTSKEREWIRCQFEDALFTEVRTRYIETHRALQHTEDVDSRSRILREWREYLSSCQINGMEPSNESPNS